MPVLANKKHEKFAQFLADGKTQGEAYVLVGGRGKPAHKEASRYCIRNPSIEARALELRTQAHEREQMKLDVAAEVSGTSKGYVMQRLHELVERCMQHYPVLDKEGAQVYVEVPGPDGSEKLAPAYTFDAKGAARGLHLLGLEHGMFTQRLKIERSPFDGLPAPTLLEIAQHLAQMRGRVIDMKDLTSHAPTRSLVDRSTPT